MVRIEIAGLSKLIIANNHKLRIFWIVALLLCFSCFSYHFYLQLKRYFSYGKVTDTNYIDNGFQFPDVTICPTEPYRRDKFEQQNLQKVHSDLLQLWSSILLDASLDSKSFEKQLSVYEAAQHSLSLAGGRVSSALRSLDEDLVFCQFQKEMCSAANFSFYRHPIKQNCYIFQAKDSMRVMTRPGEDNGLFLVLNMSGSASILSPIEKLSHQSGYVVDINTKRTKPQFQTASFLAPVNYLTNAEISMTTIKDISTPIDRCHTDARAIKVVDDFNSEPWKSKNFSQVLGDCRESELQMQLEISCRCLDGTLIVSDTQKGRLCHALPQRLWDQMNFQVDQLTANERSDMLKRAQCYILESKQFKRFVLDIARCYNPCEKILYSKTINSNPWPNNYPIEDVLKQIYGGQDLINFTSNEEKSTSSSGVVTGLVAVKVFSLSLTSIEIDKKRGFDWIELISEGGGIIGLWIGWCMFTIFEMIELCLKSTVCKDDEEKTALTKTTPLSRTTHL